MHPPVRSFLFLVTVMFALHTPNIAEPPGAGSPQSNLQPMYAMDRADQSLITREVAAGNDYMLGHGVPQDVHLAAESYENAAKAGDASAQNQIGYLYQVGIGVPQNMERAVHWYQLSAANGSMNGKVNLAVLYVLGLGVRQDSKLGESLLKEASKKGSGIAAAYLGDMYLSGIGVAPDREKAIASYEHGVRLHSYYAQYKMALFLSKPDNQPLDLSRSVSLLRKSISGGYVPAMYLLGLIAVNHPESNVSHDEALTLLRDASDAGLWKASAILGILSRDGKWVQNDKEEAYRYFKRASLQGDESVAAYVRNDLHMLTTKLDSGTVERLNVQTADWESKHSVPVQTLFKNGERLIPFSTYSSSPRPDPGQEVGVSPVSDLLTWDSIHQGPTPLRGKSVR